MAVRPVIRAVYEPANSIGEMNRGRARRGVGPSRNKSMAEFLLSEQLEAPVAAATQDIAGAARGIAHDEIHSETSSGNYERSIHAERGDIVVISGNPRVSGVVVAHGGRSSYGGFTDPESSIAAVVEYGNPSAPHSGRRILGRAGQPWHTEKKPL